MLKARKTLLNPPMIVALIALIISASGVSYAVTKIGTAQIKNKAVTRAKIRNSAVNSSKVSDGSLTQSDFQTGAAVAGEGSIEVTNFDAATSSNGNVLFQLSSAVYLEGICSASNIPSVMLRQTAGTGAIEFSFSGIANDFPVEPYFGSGGVSGGIGGIGMSNSSSIGYASLSATARWGASTTTKTNLAVITGTMRNLGTGCNFALSATSNV